MTPQRLLIYLLIIAFVAAPFLGLLYGPTLGLIMLTLAIGLTLGLTIPAGNHAPPEQQSRLAMMIKLNWALLALALVFLIVSVIA
jgi:hypothetical protein